MNFDYQENNNLWNFNNSYLNLPNELYTKEIPLKSNNPFLVYFNPILAKELGLDFLCGNEKLIIDYLSGNKVPDGSALISHAYSGHQFGHFTMLGDGRAILLGEHINGENKRYDIQLKGSGKTYFSRGGDGLATLSSMLREYVMSESMHYLGIPTTRSLAVIGTGRKVYREEIYNGGILTRIASSHIRVGTFEYISNFCDNKILEKFAKYVIRRHFPDIINVNEPFLELLKVVMQKQINLIVDWMRVGFIHGVMNTDNMSICGETIDFGPCSFINIYDPNTVFSSIDIKGRYAFSNQPRIAHWNLSVFANTLLPLISENKAEAIEKVQIILNEFSNKFSDSYYKMMCAKIGILKPSNLDRKIVDDLMKLMFQYKSDYNNTFAALTLKKHLDEDLFSSKEFLIWKEKWEYRLGGNLDDINVIKKMQKNNPLFIPRNYLIEEALEYALNGNVLKIDKILKDISTTYNYTINFNKFQFAPEGYDDNYKTYCGT